MAQVGSSPKVKEQDKHSMDRNSAIIAAGCTDCHEAICCRAIATKFNKEGNIRPGANPAE